MRINGMIKLKKILKKANLETLEGIFSLKVFNVELSILVIVMAIGVYALIFSYFAIMKDFGFRTYAWDLGIFNQALWTTSHNGKFFYYTCELLINPSGSFFGIHFSPILFLVLPFYMVYPASQTLLAIQSFILALGAVPLYKLVKDVLKYRVAGFVFVLVYLLYPPLQGVNWFDFHVQCFLPLFFLSAVYFFEKQNWKAYFLFIFLSLMVEEHASLIVMFIGIFGFLQHKTQIISILKAKNFKDAVFFVPVATMVLAVLWYVMTSWVRDYFFPINPSFLYEFKAAANWSILGFQDPIMIPLYVFLYPARAISAIGYDFLAKVGYLLILLGPLALKPFSSMKHVLPAVPWLFFALFSNYQPYYGIFNQYPAYVISFIFIAAVYAISKEGNNLKVLKKPLATIFLCSLAAFMLVSPLSPVVSIVYPEYGLSPITEHEEFIHEILTYVPANASVMTQSNIFPHVSSRINAYAIPVIHQIWIEKISEFRDFANETLNNVEYVLVDFGSDPSATELMFSLMLENRGFKVFVSADSVILFKKNYENKAKMLAPYKVTYTHSSLALYSGEIVEDPNSTSGTVMYLNGSSGASPMFWYGPRSILPPGRYNITLRIKLNFANTLVDELFTLELCSNNGQRILNSTTFLKGDFAYQDTWINQTFYLNLDEPLIDFETKVINVSEHVDMYLDYIAVKQIAIP